MSGAQLSKCVENVCRMGRNVSLRKNMDDLGQCHDRIIMKEKHEQTDLEERRNEDEEQII